MQFSFTDEQDQFRDMVRRFADDRSPTTEVRRLMATEQGYDESVWQQLSGELGLTALQIPEQYGGAGFGPVELGIVMEEFGRALVCAPYFSSAVLATNTLLAAADETSKAEFLPGLADGSRRATLALVEAGGSWALNDISMIAQSGNQEYSLSGTKHFVIDGATADSVITVARLGPEQGLSLFMVDAREPSLKRTPLDPMDSTRKLARLEFTDTPARLLGRAGEADAGLAHALDLAAIALAGEMVGGAQALLDSAVAYAKMRVQFGRTIGSFQAIKHKCADMLLDVESAKSAAYCAASGAAAGADDLPALASLAKAATADAYVRTAAETIQVHGGIGFTWENDTHLWFKRAKSSEVLLGDPTWHRERMMQCWGY